MCTKPLKSGPQLCDDELLRLGRRVEAKQRPALRLAPEHNVQVRRVADLMPQRCAVLVEGAVRVVATLLEIDLRRLLRPLPGGPGLALDLGQTVEGGPDFGRPIGDGGLHVGLELLRPVRNRALADLKFSGDLGLSVTPSQQASDLVFSRHPLVWGAAMRRSQGYTPWTYTQRIGHTGQGASSAVAGDTGLLR